MGIRLLATILLVCSCTAVPGSDVVRVGNTAHVSGQVGQGGSFANELQTALRRIDAALASVGLSKHHIVKSEGILADIGDLDELNFYYNQWLSGVQIVGVMTVWEGAALRSGARVEIAVVASSVSKTGHNVSVNNGNYPVGPYTSAVAVGDEVYISGMQGGGDSFEEQVEDTLRSVDEALATLGLNKEHIVSVEGIVGNIDDLGMMNVIYNRWLSGVEVLPAMMVHQPVAMWGSPHSKVEITVIASRLHKTGTNITNSDETQPAQKWPLPFTAIVEVGDKGYLSGKLSWKGRTTKLQLADVLLSLEETLMRGGFTKHDIVQSRVVLANLEDLNIFTRMYREWFYVSGVQRLPAIMVHQPTHLSAYAQVEIGVECTRTQQNLLV